MNCMNNLSNKLEKDCKVPIEVFLHDLVLNLISSRSKLKTIRLICLRGFLLKLE